MSAIKTLFTIIGLLGFVVAIGSFIANIITMDFTYSAYWLISFIIAVVFIEAGREKKTPNKQASEQSD